MKKTMPALLAACLAGAGTVAAMEIRQIENASGQAVFEARFLGTGDGAFIDGYDGVNPEVLDQGAHATFSLG